MASVSATPSPTPVFIYIEQPPTKRAHLQFLSILGGTISNNPNIATTWLFTSNGELMTSGGAFVSTSGTEPFLFNPSNEKREISNIWAVTNRTVSWTNSRFPSGQASFCLMGSNVWIYFVQPPPVGCLPVNLAAIPKDDVIPPVPIASTSVSQTQQSLSTASPSPTPSAPGTIYGTLATAEPVGCFSSPIGGLALNSPNTTVATLEQCVDVCAAYINSNVDYHYVGVQFGEPLQTKEVPVY